ncbi:MAG TPA: cytidine deaminase [Crocinitomix sp.]|nr:cytidine deaminase [Crocinitomix sp.]
MKEYLNQVKYYITDTLISFSEEEQLLIKETIAKAKNAYAPYSKFNVSAGVLFNKKEIITATNIENASYPIGTCAERNVLSYFLSNYPQAKINTIAVYAENQSGKLKQPITPCGMCRQALLEAENIQSTNIKVIMIGNTSNFLVVNKCAHLLPFAFDDSVL